MLARELIFKFITINWLIIRSRRKGVEVDEKVKV